MLAEVTVRAWKDRDFADALRADGEAVPASPAGVAVLDDDALDERARGGDLPKTGGVVCGIIIISGTLSCYRCDTTLFDGTCGAASIGCCPNAE
jgi:mersacidin/lichenicidin family type 2 lantibiotic